MNPELKNSSLQKLNDNLIVIITGSTKVAFAFNMNFGYIENGILFLKDEYAKGGAKFTSFMEEYANVLKEVYQLEAITTESQVEQMVKSKRELDNLYVMIKREKDLVKAASLVTESERIYNESPSQASQQILVEIKNKYNELVASVEASSKVSETTETLPEGEVTYDNEAKKEAKKKEPKASKDKKKSGKKAGNKKSGTKKKSNRKK